MGFWLVSIFPYMGWMRLIWAAVHSNHLPVKINNRNTRKRYEVCVKLTIKSPKRRQWSEYDVFIFNFQHISHFFLVFLLLAITGKYLLGGYVVHTPSWHLLVQKHLWQYKNNVWNLFKVNNKDTRTMSMTSFWCLYC